MCNNSSTNIHFSHHELALASNSQVGQKGSLKVKRQGKRIVASLVDTSPLPQVTFTDKSERNNYVIHKRNEGHTLQTIADSLGLTREMIRLIVISNQGPSASEVRKAREEKKRGEAAAALKSLGPVSIDEIAQHLEETPSRVRKLLGKAAKTLPNGRMRFEKIYSDEDLLTILRNAASKIDGPLSVSKYRRLQIQPTVAIYIGRFGSWNSACELAGVTHGLAMRENYKRAHSEEDMLAYVASYIADPRTNGSATGYDRWQRNVDGAPSLSLIRQRVGSWNEIKVRLARGA